MQRSNPSRTALRVALRRAAHQIYDSPLVFDDPIAVPILGAEYAEELRRTPNPHPTQKQRPFSIALRAFLVARSRYAEDQLVGAVSEGTTQYVLLGAGLDTFAYRNPFPQLRVFEIDHPATQAWKRELLSRTNLTAPQGLTYAPVDFERASLQQGLAEAGFDRGAKTVFAWLGVVPYLTLGAFRATVATIARQPRGSGVVFDYSQPRSALGPLEQLAHDSLSARVALAGEPFQLFFTPDQIVQELRTFSRMEDLGTAELNMRYFTSRADQLQARGDAGRLVSAWL